MLRHAQKPKKRLSFKEPEVEGPRSIENLSLEVQALKVVQSVGTAFSDLSLQDSLSSNYLDIVDSSTDVQDSQIEAYSNDCFLNDEASYQTQRISALNMRCPEMQGTETRNHIPAAEKGSSAQQHQIQLLKYQLEQQSQQTQLALHQVHFLTEQLESECAARRKAQEQNSQLMDQNKELLSHIEKLFQQIEDLEKQVQVLEHDKRVPQGSHQRLPRRLSSDPPDKPSPALAPRRKTSLAAPPTTTRQPKPTAPSPANRGPVSPPRPIATALHIGDTCTPFGSGGWKAPVHQQERGRAGSFSRLKPPSENTPSGGITNKKYSSSTSDLCSCTKPLDEPGKSSILSNLNLSAPSKLPRFQPYVGGSRRSSLSKDDQFGAASGKDRFGKPQGYNR